MKPDTQKTVQVNATTKILVADVSFHISRASGHGGQKINKTSSKVDTSFTVRASSTLTDEQKDLVVQKLGPVVTATAQDTRSQHRNRELALERVRAKLAGALVKPKPRKETKTSEPAEAKRVEGKRRQGDKKKQRQRPAADDF